MLLSDVDLHDLGPTLIHPFDAARVQPASYDLTLGTHALLPDRRALHMITPGHTDVSTLFRRVPFAQRNARTFALLSPGGACLASTAERLTVPDWLAARVEGKSTLGRHFVSVHVTAGFIDPGFDGHITLEIVNHGPWTIVLTPGQKIAQVNFTVLLSPAARPYGSEGLGSHYQGQTGPTPPAVR